MRIPVRYPDTPLTGLPYGCANRVFQFTVNVTEVECVKLPEVPVTVSVYVPLGVPGERGEVLPLPPPQEAESTSTNSTRVSGASHLLPSFPRFNASHKTERTVRPSGVNKMAAIGATGKLVRRGIASIGAVVVTLTVTVAALVPLRATAKGETEHVASDGAPAQAKEMG